MVWSVPATHRWSRHIQSVFSRSAGAAPSGKSTLHFQEMGGLSRLFFFRPQRLPPRHRMLAESLI
jgi:hypothetical protein